MNIHVLCLSIDICFHFFGVDTQEWNGYVILQMYVQLFKKLSNCFPPAVYENSSCFISSPTLIMISLFYFNYSNKYQWCFIVALICLSLILGKLSTFLVCLFAILYLLQSNVSSDILPILKQEFLSYYCIIYATYLSCLSSEYQSFVKHMSCKYFLLF